MNLRTSSVLAISSVFFLAACQQSKPKTGEEGPSVDPKLEVSCEGIGEVKLSDSYDDLVKKFGDTALTPHTNSLRGSYTSIWEGKPEQIDVYWKDKSSPYIHVADIETASSEAPYTTKDGLRGGMTMKEVQKINTNMPLTFVNPYASEEPGLITTFNNGQIVKDLPCIGGYVDVTKTRNVDEATIAEFRNEKVVDGTHRLFQERITAVFSRFRITAK
jgi:hypothetical protein